MASSNGHTAGKTITWDRPMLNRFKMAINKAKGMKGDTFTFDGHEFVIGYAEYLAAYLDERLK